MHTPRYLNYLAIGATTALLMAVSLASTAATVAKASGTRLEPLRVQARTAEDKQDATTVSRRHCTADGHWCVRTVLEGPSGDTHLEVAQRVAGEREARYRHVPLAASAGGAVPKPWPYIVRLAPGVGVPGVPSDPAQAALENVLVGVERPSRQVTLSRIYHTDDDVQVDGDRVTLSGDAAGTVRACITQADAAAGKFAPECGKILGP